MFEQLGRWLRRHQGVERNPIYQLASDVVEGRMSAEAAYQAVERSSLLNQLADGDLWELEREAMRIAVDDPEHALILSRLTILAARYKGFDRVLVDANLRAAEILAELGEEHDQELHLREALHAAERIANVPGQRRALSKLARLALNRGDTVRARELLARQLDAGREDVDSLEEVETALLLGDLARDEGDAATAREYYHRAGRGARRVGHFSGVVDALLRQVEIVRQEGDVEGTYLLLQQAAEAAERTVDGRLQAEIAIQIATLLMEYQEFEQASPHLRKGLERARAIGDITMESRCLAGLAHAEQQAGLSTEAAQHYQELADLEERIGNRPATVRALLESAELLLATHAEARRVLALLERALPSVQSLHEPAALQRTLGLLGLSYAALGRRSEALDNLMAALRYARESGDVAEEGRWYLGIAEVLYEFGETDDAAAAARQALEIAREQRDPRLEARALALSGALSQLRGLYREAEDAFQRALVLAHGYGDAEEQVQYLQLLARLARQSGQPATAIRYLRRAVEIATPNGAPTTIVRLHGQLGQLHRSLNQLKEAAEYYEQALAAAQAADLDALALRALNDLAVVLDLAGDLERATLNYRQGIALAERLGDQRTALVMHYNLGAILIDQAAVEEARQHLNHAVELAMSAGDFATADAARELLRRIGVMPDAPGAPAPRDEDFLVGEIAVGEVEQRQRDLPRG